MRSDVDRSIVAALAAFEDMNAFRIARMTRIPRSTVRDWLHPKGPPAKRSLSRFELLARLPEQEYSYLLGFHLGDGALSSHRRGVYRLRIATDVRYPRIIEECAAAMQAVMPDNRVDVRRLNHEAAVVISCYSKAWPVLLPQHGPGRKHTRTISLEAWQQEIVDRYTREFVRGLIHSDGCRVLNRVNGKAYPRYFFEQVSDGIRRIFCDACRSIGVRYTQNKWNSISIARAPSVAILDSFIGPKA